MKRLFIAICICVGVISSTYANDFTKVQKDGITFQYISFHPKSSLYKLDFVTTPDVKSLSEILAENNAITGINGIFFCPEDYSECDGKNFTINERIVDGVDYSAYSDTGERGIFGWDKEYNTLLFKTNSINSEYRDVIYEGMGNYPIILHNGESMIPYYKEVGLIDKKMSSAMSRHFICNNAENGDIIFGKTSAVSLEKLAPSLTKIGCYNALNLDAGLSSYMTYNGRTLETGVRKVLDAIVISAPSIDVQEINSRLDSVIEKYFGNLDTLPNLKAKKTLEAYIKVFQTARTQLYEANSINIMDDSGNIQGYTIQIEDPKILERIYTINIFQEKLEDLKNELE